MNDEVLIRKYAKSKNLNEEYEKKLHIKDVWCNAITTIGCDYDGCNTVESLKNLIDELVDYAAKALECNNTNPAYDDFDRVLGD